MEPRKPLPPVLCACGGAEQHVREVVERLRSKLRVEGRGSGGVGGGQGRRRKEEGRKKEGRNKEERGKEEDEKGQ